MTSTAPPFDRAKVLDNLGGDEELLAEIAGLFAAAWPEILAKLRAALAAADADSLRAAAHALKGAVANFCADTAVHAVRRLEITSKAGDLSGAPAQLDDVVVAVEQVIAALGGQRR